MDLSKNQELIVDKLFDGAMWSAKRLAYELDWTLNATQKSLYRLEKRNIVKKYTRGGIWWRITPAAYIAYKEKYVTPYA